MRKLVSFQVTPSIPQGQSFCPTVLRTWVNIPLTPCRYECSTAQTSLWRIMLEQAFIQAP